MHKRCITVICFAYKKLHYTETSLLKVYNDKSLIIDTKRCHITNTIRFHCIFDTVDYFVRLDRLSRSLGSVRC